MGYDMSEAQYNRLERNRADGRMCAMSTGRGGCFNRANRMVVQEATNLDTDGNPFDTMHPEGHVDTMPFCKRHADDLQRTAAYYSGVHCQGYKLIEVKEF
jgi:hypothetical protein